MAPQNLPNWQLTENGKLHRRFQFKDFVEAFSFLTSVALESEKLGHHPEIFCVYNKVELWLTTHDAGGLTDLDTKLAGIIDGLV
ncbi:MAG: 4a-hydroxytetrahydrobiopterin dehydratase [Microbacteriaceae bacterium]|nr:4a-hydroxytetrahydrobiopterin dehydratase [Microbacteriaceae bacterium]